MDYNKQQNLNLKHIINPQEGDFWHEMFCPYFYIVAVDIKGVLALYKTIPVGSDHYRFDENEIKYMTKEELKNSVTYEAMRDKFVANVRTKTN